MLNIDIKSISIETKSTIIYIYQMNKILDIVKEIKQNITDNQYKSIMKSLMEINNTNKLPLLTSNHKYNKIIYFFNWLETKLKITDHQYNCIKKMDLQRIK